MGVRLCSFSLHLRHRIFGVLPILCITGLRGREKWIRVYQIKNIYPSEHFLNQSVKNLSQISRLRIWCPSRKFGHEMNLKGLLYLVLLD